MVVLHHSQENTIQRFRELQTQLRQRFQTLSDQELDDQDVVVIPSLSLDNHQLEKIPGAHQYEERLLFSLIRLRNPRMRLIYVSSQPIHPTVIDYYLHLMPGIPISHIRDRLLLFSTYDTSPKPLTQKITEDLTKVTLELWSRQPNLNRIVVKLNQGFSGEGNALLDLRPLKDLNLDERAKILKNYWDKLSFQAPNETRETFRDRISQLGAIVEVFIEGEIKESPSVQCEIDPNGKTKIISTHDQILGGPDGQIFQGCRFPAQAAYRLKLQEMGEKIGQNLANKGALERFGVDFIAVYKPDSLDWDLQAIEINLRRGGTTHPFMTLKLLTNGYYDLQTGLFYSRKSQPKFYIASDNLQHNKYQGLLPNDLMDIIVNHQLHFDSSTETGTVFHLMGCLSRYGKLGLTCIGDSPEQAQDIYDRVVDVLNQETEIQPFKSWENYCLSTAIPLVF